MTTARPMRWGLVCAMAEELRSLLPHLEHVDERGHGGRRFLHGRLEGHPVVAVRSGIGKVAAAATTAMLLDRHAVDAVLFTGVAGGLGPGVAVGDVVVARATLQHDFDASPIVPRHVLPEAGISRFGADAALSDRLASVARACSLRVHEGLVVSGDRFVSTAAESCAIAAELPDALAVDMEGAAAAQVCHDFERPFAMIRTISDRADDDAHVDFQAFLDDVAAEVTHRVVRAMLADGAA